MHKHFRPAFTIVELLIVVVVIAILAAIAIVAYNGVNRQVASSVAQNILRDAGKAMEMYKIKNDSYPTTLPSSITPPQSFGIAITEVSNNQTEFCLNATTTRYSDLGYSIDQTQTIKEELCPGATLTTYGDYNTDADPQAIASPWVTAPTAGHKTAPGDMNFTAQTNDNWTQLTLSWNAMEGATQYRLNTSHDKGGNWYARNTSDGSGGAIWNHSSNVHSSNISPDTTSLSWTSSSSIPQNLSSTHMYRIQYLANDVWSDWQELSLSPIENNPIPKLQNFKVVPTEDWSQITLSWDGIGNYANIPGLKVRLNTSHDKGGNWYARNTSDGSGGAIWNHSSNVRSSNMTPDTTILSWTSGSSIPSNVSSPHMYRIQLYSGDEQGEWATFELDPLDSVGGSLPAVSNFDVSYNNDMSAALISWGPLDSKLAGLPGLKVRVNLSSNGGENWHARTISDGGGSYAWNYAANTQSGNISPSVNSMSWTAVSSKPSNLSQVYKYRIQLYSGSEEGPWTVVDLDPMAGVTIPAVAGFTVTPAGDWSNVVISWNTLDERIANLPGVRFRVNHSRDGGTTWDTRSISSGDNVSVWDSPTTGRSGVIPIATNQMTWKYSLSKPNAAGVTHQYRIQVYSGDVQGPWTTFTLTR